MPRKARLIIENGCYHVISRGIRKVPCFFDDGDYKKYLAILKKYKQQFEFKLYGWCLMPNHPHLVIESNYLSRTMHAINLSYEQYFNYKYNKVGYLWQNRFKSFVVNNSCYLLDLIAYIEYNPIRANIVQKPEDYRWSSYKARVLGINEFGLLDQLDL